MEEQSDARQAVWQVTVDEVGLQSDRLRLSQEDDCCVICLERISERAITVPCLHQTFDFLCLVSWLQERSTCPLCKTEVASVRYDFRTPEDFKLFPVSTTINITSQFNTSSARSSQRFRPFCPNIRRRIRRQSRPIQAIRTTNSDAVLIWRRHVYSAKLYSLHVGSNRLSRFHDIIPELFRKDEELISRARKWIRRELQVFEFLNSNSNDTDTSDRRAGNAEFLLEYIVAILKTVDIKSSDGQAEDMVQDFLGRDNAKLFLHELRAWLRSPYNSLEDWDRAVQYLEPVSGTKKRAATEQNEHAGDHAALASQPRSRRPDARARIPYSEASRVYNRKPDPHRYPNESRRVPREAGGQLDLD